jgi:hypothetical protein
MTTQKFKPDKKGCTGAINTLKNYPVECFVRGMKSTYTLEKDWEKTAYVDILSTEILEICREKAEVTRDIFKGFNPDTPKTEYAKAKNNNLLACRFYNSDPYNYIDIDLKDQTLTGMRLTADELESRVIELAKRAGFLCIEQSVSGGIHIIVATEPIEQGAKWQWADAVYTLFMDAGIVIDTKAVRKASLLYWTSDILWINTPERINKIERWICEKNNVITSDASPSGKNNISTSDNNKISGTYNNNISAGKNIISTSNIKNVITSGKNNISNFMIDGRAATDDEVKELRNMLENDDLVPMKKPLSHKKQYPFLGSIQAMGYAAGCDVWNKVRYAIHHTTDHAKHNKCFDLTTLYR